MKKYIREIDGIKYVGVVIAPGFGAGWSTWNFIINPCDGDFIKFLIDNGNIFEGIDETEEYEVWTIKIDTRKVENYWKNERKYNNIYCGGTDDLEIHWIEKGDWIRITEYDGAEKIEFLNPTGYFKV